MTVKLRRKKFAFSENSIMFAPEIKNGDYLGYSFFLILISKTPLKEPSNFGPGHCPTSRSCQNQV